MNNPKKNPLVSVIIVNYNGKQFLKTCLASLNKQEYKNIEIIFVDNGSKDGSVDYVRTSFPKVALVELSRNIGFAGGNNAGLSHAHGEFVLLLNNDTRVTPNFISELIRVFENDDSIGATQSKLLVMDNPSLLDSVGAYLTPTGFLYHYGYAKKDSAFYDRQITTYSAKGACMMIRKCVLDAVLVDGEMFDSDYFAYFEETDLCHRIWLAGYKIVFVPTSVVYHKMGATSSRMVNAFIQYHSFKNRMHSYIKNLGFAQLLRLLPIHILICFGYMLFDLISGKPAVSVSIVRAMMWNVRMLPDTLRKRAIIQSKIRTVSDSDFWKYIFEQPPLIYYRMMMTNLETFKDVVRPQYIAYSKSQ